MQVQGCAEASPWFPVIAHKKTSMYQYACFFASSKNFLICKTVSLFLHRIKNTLVAAFYPYKKKPCACLFQCLHGLKVYICAGIGRPLEFKPLLRISSENSIALLIDRKRIVLKHYLLKVGKIINAVLYFINDIFNAPVSQFMAVKGLGIKAVNTVVRTTPSVISVMIGYLLWA